MQCTRKAPPRLTGTSILCLLATFLCASGRKLENVVPGSVHTIISTECSRYFSFQTLALAYSHRAVGQPGALTRVMSCKPEDLALFSPEDMSTMDTHVTPSFSLNPSNGDYYSPYNKPSGILHWLAKVQPKEEWILIMDADTIFRRQILPTDLPPKWIAAAHYDYLVGSYNDLAQRHIGEVPKQMDTFGGQKGRRADEAGAYYLLRRTDLQALAPLWKKYTEDVRNDPNAWNLTGDSYVKPGQRAWISEMYGWIYAAAKVGLKHKLDPSVQVYPSQDIRDFPKIIHYGLEHKLPGFRFDKHDHKGFDFMRCPPWDLSANRSQHADAGLFPHPPHPSKIGKIGDTDWKQYGLLLNIEFMNTVNAALCERHRRKCPDSDELTRECNKVDSITEALRLEFAEYEKTLCRDEVPKECPGWAQRGECRANWMVLQRICRKTCGGCFAQDQPSKKMATGADVKGPVKAANRTRFQREGAPLGEVWKQTMEEDTGVHENSIGDDSSTDSLQWNFDSAEDAEQDTYLPEPDVNDEDVRLSKADYALLVGCLRMTATERVKAPECLKFDLLVGRPMDGSTSTLMQGISILWLGIEFVCLAVVIAIVFVCAKRERPRRRQKPGSSL